jgi:hypothetical protein
MQALRTEQLNTETLTALADNADNTVYGYAYDVPETTLDPATQVALFKDIVAAFDAYCVDKPTLCDEGLQEHHPVLPSVFFNACTQKCLRQ